MLKPSLKEPKEIRDVVNKILKFHFQPVLSKPLPQKTKVSNAMAWIEKAAEQLKEKGE